MNLRPPACKSVARQTSLPPTRMYSSSCRSPSTFAKWVVDDFVDGETLRYNRFPQILRQGVARNSLPPRIRAYAAAVTEAVVARDGLLPGDGLLARFVHSTENYANGIDPTVNPAASPDWAEESLLAGLVVRVNTYKYLPSTTIRSLTLSWLTTDSKADSLQHYSQQSHNTYMSFAVAHSRRCRKLWGGST